MPAHKKNEIIIWTHNLAYVVGLITTDGNLSKDGRHLAFTSNDLDLIESLKNTLGLKNYVAKKKSGYTGKLSSFQIQFGNVVLHRWLCDIGLMPNKSKQLGVLNIPDEFFFDFLRGHLDGGGSIKKYYDAVYPKSLRLYTVFMSASLKHLIWIRDTVLKLIQTEGRLGKIARAHTLTFSKQNSIKLLSFLYPHAQVPRLERKFLIAKEFVNF